MQSRTMRSRPLRTLLLTIVCAALAASALNCNWGSSSPPAIQTEVKPTIISTFPPNGGTGPYNLYTPRPDTTYPHFSVYFSKTMDISTINSATITCSGFRDSVNCQVLSQKILNGDNISFLVVMRKGGKPALFDINTTYTVSIDASVTDNLGNPLGTTHTFSFKPEPYFRAVTFNFNNGDTLIPNSVAVYFNSKLSQPITSAVSITPGVSSPVTIDTTYDSTSVVINTALKTVPGTSYAVEVSGSAADGAGNTIHSAVQRSFTVPPIVISRSVFSLQDVNLSTQFRLSFNYPMVVSSIDSAFSFTPATTLITSAGSSELSLHALNDFLPNTDYTISLSTVLSTINGFHIASPYVVQFHTAQFAVTHLPANGEVNVSTHDIIELDFTGAVNTLTVPGNVTVTPATAHTWTFSEGTTPGKEIYAYFVPTAILGSGVTYQVIISDSIQSIAGYYLAAPDTFSFRTGY